MTHVIIPNILSQAKLSSKNLNKGTFLRFRKFPYEATVFLCKNTCKNSIIVTQEWLARSRSSLNSDLHLDLVKGSARFEIRWTVNGWHMVTLLT